MMKKIGGAIADTGKNKPIRYKKKRVGMKFLSPSIYVRRAGIFVTGISELPLVTHKRQYGGGEAEGVMPSYIAAEIKAFETRFRADHPLHSGSSEHVNKPRNFGGNRVEFMGAMTWLEQESGVHVRRLSGYKNCEFAFVQFSDAQKILMALDREYKLNNGEIPVVKNPRWSWRQYFSYMRSRGVV